MRIQESIMKTIILQTRSAFTLLIALLMATTVFAAYSAHQNDQDINKFLNVYPFAKSTKLDDCALCHPGGKVGIKQYGSCDYCHITYSLQPPHGQIPLNYYGEAYKNAGRGEDAIRNIEVLDSDGDGYNNLAEISKLFFPGDPTDNPKLLPAQTVVMNMERILKLPDYSQYLLGNTTKSGDQYARYRGVRIKDLLWSVGLRPDATQITVFAPDGFSKTFPIDVPDPQSPSSTIQYDVMGPYPNGYYYAGLDFVDYTFDPGYPYENGFRIPDKLYMILGYLRDGDPLIKGKLSPDPASPSRLVLDGEGPYRLIVPQKIAGPPDRPSTASQVGDGWDYDSNKDHNWGFAVRSVAAIRVEPLPPGTADFNWWEGGWNLVDKARVVIYGAIYPGTLHVRGQVTDSKEKPIAGVRISFGLLSLGQAGEAATEANGRFHMNLPVGEYIVIPSKEGYTFNPESVAIQLSEKGQEINFIASPVLP
jgi:hypothetical protein